MINYRSLIYPKLGYIRGLTYVMSFEKSNCGAPINRCEHCLLFCSTKCDKCIIRELKQKITNLESLIAFHENWNDEQFDVDINFFYDNEGHKSLKSTIEFDLTKLYFLTITFDPDRFKNLGVKSIDEEHYILFQLARAKQENLIQSAYGCFELTKNGVTHAHALIKTLQPIETQQFLKQQFTYNMRNNRAIQLDRATKGAQAYVDKIEDGKGCENKSWYNIALGLMPIKTAEELKEKKPPKNWCGEPLRKPEYLNS